MQALKEFSIREILSAEKKKMRTSKRQIEPKQIMKERTGGKSPDEADACCVCLDTVRVRLNVHPGSAIEAKQDHSAEDDFAVEYDLDEEEGLYLTEQM